MEICPGLPAVLIVDDEPLIRMYAADGLTDAGFQVFEAQDAAEAMVVLIQHDEIGVLFTDINMPGPLDGLELARRVHEVRPEIQLIITSGKERPTKVQIPDHGDFLQKPYNVDAVQKLIRLASDRG